MTNAHGVAAGHGAHLLMTLGPMVLIALAATLADLRHRLRRPALPVAVTVAAALSMAAGVVHLAASPDHFAESALYGVFFVVCGVAQLAWPVLVTLQPSRWALWAGAAGNLSVACLWLWTRTAGIPLGPERGAVEPVAPVDLAASLAELGIVVLCGWLLAGAAHRTVSPQPEAV
jgi:hypothetical protein